MCHVFFFSASLFIKGWWDVLLKFVVRLEDRKRNERTAEHLLCVRKKKKKKKTCVFLSTQHASVCDLTSCCPLNMVHLHLTDTISLSYWFLSNPKHRCSLSLARARILLFESRIKVCSWMCVCACVCLLLSHVGRHCNRAMEDAAASLLNEFQTKRSTCWVKLQPFGSAFFFPSLEHFWSKWSCTCWANPLQIHGQGWGLLGGRMAAVYFGPCRHCLWLEMFLIRE